MISQTMNHRRNFFFESRLLTHPPLKSGFAVKINNQRMSLQVKQGLASIANAIVPEAIGVAALVPEC